MTSVREQSSRPGVWAKQGWDTGSNGLNAEEVETSQATGLLGMKETQSFARGENIVRSNRHLHERSRQRFKLWVFNVITLLVARDRNPTQTRLAKREVYWLIQLRKISKRPHRKGERTAELVFEIRKRDSLTVEFSLSPSNSRLHVAWEMASSRHKVLSYQLKIHNRKMAVSWHPWFSLHCLEERVLFMGLARVLHIGKWFLEEGMQVDKNNCSLPHLERKLIALLSAFNKNHFYGIRMLPKSKKKPSLEM